MYKDRVFTVTEFFPHDGDSGAYRDIIRMDKDCFDRDERHMPEKGYYWMAFEENATGKRKDMPVGYCGIEISKIGKQKFGYMNRAAVMKHARGCGLQKRFIQIRIARARAEECKFVITNTFENAISGNNLIKVGFKLYEPKKPLLADGTCYWRLEL